MRILRTGVFVLAAVLAMSCVSTGQPASLTDIQGKVWTLTEVKAGSKTLTLDREKLSAAGFGDYFTLTLSAELATLNGRASPNRYVGPYIQGEGQKLTLGPMAGTKMASLAEASELKEDTYYSYLNGVYQWELSNGKLVLLSNAGDEKVSLTFIAN